MSEIQFGEKDIKRLAAMAKTIGKDPRVAAEMLNYAYGLGFCQGREVTAKEFLATIESHEAPRAGDGDVS